MSYWNNRIMKTFCGPEEGWYYSINEVYYDDNGTPYAWTDPIECRGSSIDELRQDYDHKKKAFGKPVLCFETGIDETFRYMWE